MAKRFELNLLILFIILGLVLRLIFLKDGAITFGFDQARDAYTAQAIANGDLKILGPSASTPGLYHGVLYFYLITPSYWLGGGNPVVTNTWLSIINILTIIPIFWLGRLLFSSNVGLLAAFLFAISFDAVQYANWMSNPALAVLTGALFYLGLAIIVFSKAWIVGTVLTAIGLGLSIQFEVFLAYLIFPLLISLWVFKVRIKSNQILLFGLIFSIIISSMIVSYIKFGPTFLSGFANLYSAGGDPFGNWREFSPTLGLYLNRFAEYFYRGLLPFNVVVAGMIWILIVGLAIKSVIKHEKFNKKILFILILIFSHGVLIPFGGESTPFINAGLQASILILVSFFIVSHFSKHKILMSFLTLLIIFSSIYAIFKYNPQGQTVFAIQRGLTLHNELAAIDYSYQAANKERFSINTITSPFWINTVWAYLYNWYGFKRYGYLPSFHGRDQTGYLGQLPQVTNQDKVYLLIIEPLDGIPQQFAEGTLGYENSFSKIVEERKFGGIVVQKRILIKPFDQISFIK